MNSRKIAADIVTQVLGKGAYSNIVLNNELNKSELSDKDKALVTEIVYGTIKYRYTIDAILKKFIKLDFKKVDDEVLSLLRISVYQMKYLTKVPDYAIVNEAVSLAKINSVGASKFVNGVLRNYIRNKDSMELEVKDNTGELALQYSFEPWMVKLFISQYGEDAAGQIMGGLNETPDVTVRVNNSLADFESVFNEMKKAGYDVEEGYVCPEAIKIKRGRGIENNPLFKEGKVTVQDESAMLIAPAMEIESGMTVLDLCAAPGGKTTHIAELLNNTGLVKSFDIHENKLNLITDNVKRLKLNNVSVGVQDAAVFDEKLANSADRVLIDVPCSGLGIIRKKPEIKWSKSLKELKEITKIQRDIISNASRYARKGGILFYSTCTLNKEENEKIIKWFLENNENFTVEKLYFGNLNNFLYHPEGMVTVMPNDKMDGFFMTKLRRLK